LGQNSRNSIDISKAFFKMGIWKFESSRPEAAVLGPGNFWWQRDSKGDYASCWDADRIAGLPLRGQGQFFARLEILIS
jgi:hypothetical protein